MKQKICVVDYASISCLGLTTKKQVDNLLIHKVGYRKFKKIKGVRYYGDLSKIKSNLSPRLKKSFKKIGGGGVLHNYLLESLKGITIKPKVSPEKIGIFVGITSGDQELMKGLRRFRFDNSAHLNLNSISAVLAKKFNVQGDISVTSQACASSIMAIIQGCRAIESGDLDMAIIGSADTSYKANYTNSVDGEVLSKKKYLNPFSIGRDGTVPCGGAGIIILMNEKKARGIKKIARIKGYGSVNKSVITNNPATGITFQGYESSMKNALSMAKLKRVDLIGAHATGTINNDVQESKAIKIVAENTPVSFLKKYFGHGIGACTIIELVAYLELLKRKTVLGMGKINKDPSCDIIVQDKTENKKVKTLLINGAGFYGAYASLIIESLR